MMPQLMLSRLPALALIAVVAGLPATALAEQDSAGLRIIAVDTDDHPEVTVTVSAPRALVGGDLAPEAFTLTEGGMERGVEVQAVPADEAQVVVAIDTSGSMDGPPMEAAKNAAKDFVRKLPNAQIAVVEFNAEARVASPLSTDTDAHIAAIDQLYAQRSTSLYDGVALSLEQLPDSDSRPRTVVVLSDGGDTTSATDVEAVTEQIATSGVTLNVVELATETTEPAILERLAAAGDGRMVSAADPAELAEVYGAMAEELHDNYLLTYRSNTHGSAEMHVTVDHSAGTSEISQQLTLPSAPIVPFIPSVLASPWTLVVGSLLMFAAIALLMLAVLWPGRARSSLTAGRMSGTRPSASLPGMTALAGQATLLVERNLSRRGWTSGLNHALERAGINLRPGEFVVLSLCAGVAAFAAGLLLAGTLLAVALTMLVGLAARVGLSILGQRRAAKFAEQLGATLQLLAGSLRAGYGLLQAVDAVAREAESPTAEEYRRLVVETRLGRELDDALAAMDRRVGNEDFNWVMQAIGIHREVGGDLAEVLDTVAGTIRERDQIRRQVKALSAEGRLSAAILFALPFAIAGFISLTNPGYLKELFTDPIGWGMLAVGTVLLTIGGIWLRKVVRLVF